MSLRAKASHYPLALTLLTTLGLLVVPSLLLRRLPRPQAAGLEKLMANVSLLQSFRATPERPVPEIWRARLGPQAERLWRFQSRTWWQFWDGHADGQPYLALASRGLPEPLLRTAVVPPLRVGDLTIFPPDPLSRQALSQRLEPQVRRSSGLRLRCLPRLEDEQAVFWRPTGLGVLLGPLAPFLQDFQEGCLSLKINGDGLSWSGEASSVEGMVLQVPAAAAGHSGRTPAPPPAPPPNVLLEVQGSSLEHLLSGLLARELIRQPLAERYGLGPQQIALLRQSPFRLLLRPRAQGAFQASIELQVAVGANVAQWKDVLSRLAKSLEKEGLRPKAYEPQQPLALWQRSDGVVVGGWQWLSGEQAINLFLGPQPPEMVRFQPRVGNPKPAGMVLLARPRELAERGLLPPDLPEVVKRSSWLWVNADPFPGFSQPGPLSQLQGSLTLRP
jgi:hypothetical protein